MTHEPVHLIDSALLALLAAAASTVPDLPNNLPISQDANLRIYCIVGALGGAWISVNILGKATATVRERASKMFASSIVSILLSPTLFTWWNLPRNSDYLIGLSFGVAVVGVAVIQGVYNKLVDAAINAAARRLGANSNESSPDPQPKPNQQEEPKR